MSRTLVRAVVIVLAASLTFLAGGSATADMSSTVVLANGKTGCC
jgi:hypothetical protein